MFDWITNGWDFIGTSFGICMLVLAVGVIVILGRSQDNNKP